MIIMRAFSQRYLFPKLWQFLNPWRDKISTCSSPHPCIDSIGFILVRFWYVYTQCWQWLGCPSTWGKCLISHQVFRIQSAKVSKCTLTSNLDVCAKVFRGNSKENIKASHYWSFMREIHRRSVDSSHKCQWCRKHFHAIMSLCEGDGHHVAKKMFVLFLFIYCYFNHYICKY